MLSNITSNPRKETINRQSSLIEGERVYLYDDIKYTGILIRPLERTYPPRWTVALDQGGYDSPTIDSITLIAPYSIESDTEIPFCDEPKQDEPEPNISQLEQEIIALRQENAKLKLENEIIRKDLDQAKQIIRQAKDISPLMRISLKRVLRLAHDACMDVKRTVGGWILKMGEKARKFRRLADIWDVLSQNEWYLSDIFPEDKLIAVELILPPRPRKRPTPPEKKTFPLVSREEVLRRRRMGMPKCAVSLKNVTIVDRKAPV